MSLRLGLIQINVSDLGEAWRFYVGTLGLRGAERFGPGKAFHLELENGPNVLVYPASRVTDRSYPDGTGVTLVFHTADLRATVESWKRKGVTFHRISWSRDVSGIAESPFGPFIAFSDPFG